VVNGVACAHLDRAPLIVLTDRHSAESVAFEHQRLDHRALLASVVKWSATISAQNAHDVMREAIEHATAPPHGPVHIDVPADAASVVSHQSTVGQSESSVGQSESAVDQSFLMRDSRRPLLLVCLGARSGAAAYW